MKIFLKQALLLGGLYFVISSALSIVENDWLANIDLMLFGVFILSVLFLIYKKSYKFLSTYQEKYAKISVYVIAFGVVEYLSVFTIVPVAVFDNYKRGVANGAEYVSPFIAYFRCAFMVVLVVLVVSLLFATYVNFVKPKMKSKK